ncbi:MAG: hypothetical protein MI861_10405 [Pirellulales bacterium]|nr:hypothetical protein [Pirellulales bacterium]
MSQTFETQQYEPQTQVAEQQSSRGCLYGCIAVVVLGILCIACLAGGIYYVFTGQVKKYTSETPSEIPTVELSAAELEELKNRLETFRTALDEGQSADELVLTADEINALINENEQLRGRAFVRIENGQVSGEISIPTDRIPGGEGRYFNASGTFDVSLENGILVVTLTEAEVKGEAVPDEIMEAFRRENLAKEVYNDPKNAEMIRRFESVRIEEDKIVFKLRQPEEGTSTDKPDTSEGESSEPGAESEVPKNGAETEPPAEPVEAPAT